jgi:hypothetical protein
MNAAVEVNGRFQERQLALGPGQTASGLFSDIADNAASNSGISSFILNLIMAGITL